MSNLFSSLSGSPDMGGIDPQMPIPTLNLAGVEGVPTPAQLSRPAPDQVNGPDFGVPDFHVPDLQAAGDAPGGVSLNMVGELEADPMVPDLDEYHRPYGLDIHNLQGRGPAMFRPDPLLNDLLDYKQPNGMIVCNDPLMPDPTLPDLQQPRLTPDVSMSNRPGDLAPGALKVMHEQPTYQQLDGASYPDVFMDQAGMNTTRRRHMDLMMWGLDSSEEQG